MKLHELREEARTSFSQQTHLDSEFGAFSINAPYEKVKSAIAEYGESFGVISQQAFEQSAKRRYFDNVYKFIDYVKMNFSPDAKKWGQTSFVPTQH